jgi:predicted transcriptional regulator
MAGIVSIAMDVARPYTALCPTLDSEVLNVLAGTTRPLTGREVARLVGRKTHSGVLDVLNRLAEHGLVERQEAGRAFLYTLNREHLAAPAVEVLAGMRTELLSRLRQAIAAWDVAPRHVSLFGSVARGDGDTASDIDLFIVRPNDVLEDDPRWRGQLDDLAAQVARWTGNHAGIAEAAEGETKRLRKERPPIVAQLGSDAIVLSGEDVASLLGASR